MIELITLGALGVGGLVAALLAHEATHAVAAAVIPGVEVVDVQLYPSARVDARVPESHPEWVDSLVGLAPTIVGTAGAVLALTGLGWPPTSASGLLTIMLWGAYTAPSRDDITAAALGHDNADAFARVMQGCALLLASWGISMVGYGTPLQFIGQGIALGSAALLALELAAAEQPEAI